MRAELEMMTVEALDVLKNLQKTAELICRNTPDAEHIVIIVDKGHDKDVEILSTADLDLTDDILGAAMYQNANTPRSVLPETPTGADND